MNKINRLRAQIKSCVSISSVRTVELVPYEGKLGPSFALILKDEVNRVKHLITGLHTEMTDVEFLMIMSYIQDFVMINVPPENPNTMPILQEVDLSQY